MPTSQRIGPLGKGDFLYLAVVFVVAFLFGAAGALLLTAGDQPTLTPLPVAVQLSALGTGVVLAAGFLLLVLFTWRRAGGRPFLRERDRAVRTGLLPGDSPPDSWLPRLQVRQRSLSQLRWLLPLLGAVQVFDAVVRLVKPAGIYSALFYVVDAALFTALGIQALALYPARLRNIHRLIDELER